MTAADILRERARQTENVSSAAFAPTSPDLLRAVAELMDECVATTATETWCVVCGEVVIGRERRATHISNCPLAALERLIEGERDGA